MLKTDSRLSPNNQEVAAKVIDGEAILINLSNGMYYSMDGVGSWIWELVEGGYSTRQIVDAVETRYDIPKEQAEADVGDLLAELIKENLVTVAGLDETPNQLALPTSDAQLPYDVPHLHGYSDMADLLALDPPMPGLLDSVWQEPDV